MNQPPESVSEHWRVLLIEDSPSDVDLLRAGLLRHGYADIDITHAERLSDGLQHLAEAAFDVILLDLGLPDSLGLGGLQRLLACAPESPVLVLTGDDNDQLAIQALHAGAQDHVPKGAANGQTLGRAIRHAIERQRLRAQQEAQARAAAAAEARLRLVVERNADAILVVDGLGRVRLVNEAAEALFGQSRHELLGEVFGLPLTAGDATEIEIVSNGRVGQPVSAEMRVVETDWEGQTAYLATLRDVTERKRTQGALETSERRFRKLIENSTDAIAMLDAQGILVYDSPAAPGLLGYAPDDLVGKDVFALVHPDDLAACQSLFEELIRAPHTKLKVALRFRHQNGSWRWLEGLASNLLNDSAVRAIVLNYRDVTDSRETQTQIRIQAHMLDTIGQAVVATDMQGNITYWNRAAELMYGWAADEVLGRNIIEVLPSADGIDQAAEVMGQLIGGDDWTGEMTMRRREGGDFPVIIMASPMRDEQGQPFGLISVSSDLGPVKQAEKALQDTQKRFRALIEHGGDGIKLLGPEGLVTYASPSTERLIGYTAEELIGLPLSHAVHPDDLPKLERLLAELRRLPGATSAAEYRARHKDGTWHWIGASITNLLADPGVKSFVFNYRNISDSKRMEAERQRAVHLLGERLKELMVLNRLARGLQDDQRPAQEALEEIANSLPAAWQYPEVAAAQVSYGELKATSANYAVSPWRQQAEFVTADSRRGFVEVVYLEQRPVDAEGPFMAEERSTLNTLADMLRVYFDRRQAAESARRRAEEFGALYEVSRDLATQHDLPALLRAITLRAMGLMSADAGSVFLYDPGRDDLELIVNVGTTVAPGTRVNLGEGMVGQAAVTHEAVWLDEERRWTSPQAQLAEPQLRAVLQVPMLYSGELVGVLGVGQKSVGRTYAEADVRLLALFAAQAAGAVLEARRLDAAQRRAEEFAALYETSRDLAAHHDLAAMLQTITERAQRLLKATAAAMYLYDHERQELELVVAVGLPVAPGVRLAVGEGLAGKVAATREPMHVDDYHNWEGRSPQYDSVPFRAVVQVPMLYSGELVGVLSTVEITESRKYTEADVRLLSLFAGQAAGAVQETRRLETSQRRVEEFAALYETSRELAIQHNLPALLQTICERAMRLLSTHSAVMYLYDEDRQELELAVAIGAPIQPGIRLALGEGLAGKVAASRELRLLDDYHSWEGRSTKYDNVPFRAIVQVPMLYGGELVGVIGASETTYGRTFTEAEAQLLTLFAAQAAGAVQEARRLESMRQRLAELESVNKVSGALRAAQNVDEMLPILLDQILAVLDIPAGNIRLYDPLSDTLKVAVARGWFTHDSLDLAADQGISGHVFRTGLPYYAARVFVEDSHWNPSGVFPVPADWGGACVAIRTAHETVGVLLVAVQLPREISEHEIGLLTTVAEMGGNAIHRTRLYRQTEQRLQRLAALRAMDVAISASLDLHVTLDVLLDQATSQLEVHAAAVLTLSPLTQTLEFTAGRGFRGAGITRTRLRLGEGASGQAALERSIKSVDNLKAAGDRMVRDELVRVEGFVAHHAAPLIAKGQVKGVLEVWHREGFNPDPEWFEFFEALAGQAAIALDSAQLFDSLQRSNLELALAYDETIEGWSRALDLRDRETEGHTLRVTNLSMQLARMLGVPETELVHFRRGALLHDIGKVAIPDTILLKPGPLSPDEWEVMRRHPQIAYDMLSPIAYLRSALDIPYCHHERWDGTGYPRGLKGHEIPLSARIFAVLDVWDALRSDRPYRTAWPDQKVRDYLRQESGQIFDPRIVEAFLSQPSLLS